MKVTKGLVDEVLGVDALEGLGLELDPTTKELRKAKKLAAYLST